MWPWTNHGASWTLGFSICRELARYLPNCPQPYKLESGTGWPLTTFGLKGGVSLLWYKSSQFMGLKNTWFLISVCRKKVLIRSSPLHGCSPPHPHMTLSSNSIGSWPKTFADKVTCTSGWFPGTIERAFCSQTLPFWITRNPTLFPPWHLFIPHLFTEQLLCASTSRLWRYVIEQDSRPCPQGSQGILGTPPYSALVHFDSFREIDKWFHYERLREELRKKSCRFPETQNLALSLGHFFPPNQCQYQLSPVPAGTALCVSQRMVLQPLYQNGTSGLVKKPDPKYPRYPKNW